MLTVGHVQVGDFVCAVQGNVERFPAEDLPRIFLRRLRGATVTCLGSDPRLRLRREDLEPAQIIEHPRRTQMPRRKQHAPQRMKCESNFHPFYYRSSIRANTSSDRVQLPCRCRSRRSDDGDKTACPSEQFRSASLR